MNIVMRLMDRSDPAEPECVAEFLLDSVAIGMDGIIGVTPGGLAIENITGGPAYPRGDAFRYKAHPFTHVEILQEGAE